MYNSMASSQEAGSKGSTRLHMDMADAFNVMLYASSCADGSPGYAAWDLYRAEDSDKIREFLRKKFTSGSAAVTNGRPLPTQAEKAAALQNQAIAIHDPIHSQHFYLDVELRRQLWEEYEVKSYRIYQRPGEGVFIPAGCAHQVCPLFAFRILWLSVFCLGCEYGGLYEDRD
jgi:lysine-specific demethylase 3